ncbi:NUDIX hydrolase [Amphibacillus sp. Q70]|uniref:NUDIX hydrolase n=1 Tax=Amphibacillus sp. Q70 TaxID=3453416 RepID=UPI003F85A9FA
MKNVNVVYAFIYNDKTNQVLMVSNLGLGWTFPGGTVEKDETFENAVIREVKEETGLDVEVEEVLSTNETILPEEDRQLLFTTFKVKVISGTPSLQGDKEILSIKWFSVETANKIKSKYPIYPGGIESLLT